MSLCWVSQFQGRSLSELNSLPANVRLGCKCLTATNKTFYADILSPIIRCCSSLPIIKYSLQGILMGKVSLYYWPPVWLVRNQLYDNWFFCFYLQNRLIQTSPTGGQRYCKTSPFSIPCSLARNTNWVGRLRTVDLLNKVVCIVKRIKMCLISIAADLN
jgi:hypothetical protein